MLQRPICPKGAAVSPLSANTLQVPKVESGQSSSLGLLDHTSPLVVQVLGVLVAWVPASLRCLPSVDSKPSELRMLGESLLFVFVRMCASVSLECPGQEHMDEGMGTSFPF